MRTCRDSRCVSDGRAKRDVITKRQMDDQFSRERSCQPFLASATRKRFPCALTAGFPFGTNATIRPKATTSKAVPMIAESSAELDEFMMLFLASADRSDSQKRADR